MKSVFNTSWKSSSQRRKQRKYQYNAPEHIRGSFLSARLSSDLQAKHKTRSLRVRSGDKVKVMRGQHSGKIGNVEQVDNNSSKLFIQGVEYIKKDGSKQMYPIHASNVRIIDLKSDKKRV